TVQAHEGVKEIVMRIIASWHVALEGVLAGFLAADVERLIEAEGIAPERQEIGLERLPAFAVLREHLWRSREQRFEKSVASLPQRFTEALLKSVGEVCLLEERSLLGVGDKLLHKLAKESLVLGAELRIGHAKDGTNDRGGHLSLTARRRLLTLRP